jgi:hypothetical protein
MLSVAREALRIPEAWQDKREDETFRGFFGAPLDVVTDLWNRVDVFIDDKARISRTSSNHCTSSFHPLFCRYRVWEGTPS